MNKNDVLNNLQDRNNSLKSKLTHEQLKHGNFSFKYFDKYSLQIINEYKSSKSLFKSAQNIGIDFNMVIDWYIQGQLKNPKFRAFYLAIDKLNDEKNVEYDEIESENCDGEYIISEYGDGWSYKTFRNDEKIFLIANDLKSLKEKIKSKNLPLD